MKLALLNGPNLNLLGKREPEVYGRQTLADIEADLTSFAEQHGAELSCFQSNAEYELVDYLHNGAGVLSGVLINPAAFTHTSIALRDALLGTQLPFVEIHISNVYAREPFRHHSYLSDIASGVIVGCGIKGYELGLLALIHNIRSQQNA